MLCHLKKLIDFVGCKGSAFCWVGGYCFFYGYGLLGNKSSLFLVIFAIFVPKKELAAKLATIASPVVAISSLAATTSGSAVTIADFAVTTSGFAATASSLAATTSGFAATYTFIKMYNEIDFSTTSVPRLVTTPLDGWAAGPQVLSYGAILIVRAGRARLRVNFTEWQLSVGAVITLFPNDVVCLQTPAEGGGAVAAPSADFRVEMLCYDASLLRAASLQVEQAVYSGLRYDRCQPGSPVVTSIIDNMFGLLHVYMDQPECSCVTQLVLLQLKAFFIGFHEYLMRNPQMRPKGPESRRVRELFNQFMMLVERDYRLSRDVSYYARALSITPKYLTMIVRQITNETPKKIIDHYTILQLRLLLSAGQQSIKQIACAYHFSDTSFFCRYFKRHTGQSPMGLRGAHGAGGGAHNA